MEISKKTPIKITSLQQAVDLFENDDIYQIYEKYDVDDPSHFLLAHLCTIIATVFTRTFPQGMVAFFANGDPSSKELEGFFIDSVYKPMLSMSTLLNEIRKSILHEKGLEDPTTKEGFSVFAHTSPFSLQPQGPQPISETPPPSSNSGN